MTRDRDAAGRPRNARPRDALGRPLDRDQARDAGDTRIPDDLVLAGPAAAAMADQLLRSGRPFHAHEVLEAAWKSGPAGERDLWQGLAQIAVGLTHAHRGNARGAVALLRRGTQRVRSYQAQAADRQRARTGTTVRHRPRRLPRGSGGPGGTHRAARPGRHHPRGPAPRPDRRRNLAPRLGTRVAVAAAYVADRWLPLHPGRGPMVAALYPFFWVQRHSHWLRKRGRGPSFG